MEDLSLFKDHLCEETADHTSVSHHTSYFKLLEKPKSLVLLRVSGQEQGSCSSVITYWLSYLSTKMKQLLSMKYFSKTRVADDNGV